MAKRALQRPITLHTRALGGRADPVITPERVGQRHATTGQRLLDIFTVHYYPQGGEFGNDVSSAMQLRRNRSTRSLWDPTYVDETWINDKVQLIPRLKSLVTAHYHNTPIGITEYNWGAEGHINGATTQADVLGIFGREGLDVAARWTTPDATTPTYKAIKMYRNYDGNGGRFGAFSIGAASPNSGVNAYAASDSPTNPTRRGTSRRRRSTCSCSATRSTVSGSSP